MGDDKTLPCKPRRSPSFSHHGLAYKSGGGVGDGGRGSGYRTRMGGKSGGERHAAELAKTPTPGFPVRPAAAPQPGLGCTCILFPCHKFFLQGLSRFAAQVAHMGYMFFQLSRSNASGALLLAQQAQHFCR